MNDLFGLDVLSRVVHVATAIVMAGGTVFMRFVLMPAAKALPEIEHDLLRQRLMARWKRIVHAGIALLLLSGFYNYMRQITNHKGDGLYHALLGTKILLALVVFFLASAFVGRATAFEKMRQNRAVLMGVIVTLTLLIVGISGFVKVRGVPTKTVAPARLWPAQKMLLVSCSQERFSPIRSLSNVRGGTDWEGRPHHDSLQEPGNETTGRSTDALRASTGSSRADGTRGTID